MSGCTVPVIHGNIIMRNLNLTLIGVACQTTLIAGFVVCLKLKYTVKHTDKGNNKCHFILLEKGMSAESFNPISVLNENTKIVF